MASFLDTLFGGGAQQDAANANAQALQQYQGTALPALQTGYNTGTTNLNNAVGAYQPLANLGTSYNQAGTMLSNALGLNGASGYAAAGSSFQNAPGYNDAVNAGVSAISRLRAGQGMADSGNANNDVQTFGQNLQNQQYNSWLSNLQNMAGMGLNATGTAAAGQAAGDTALANLGYTYGSDQGNIANNVASGTMADNNMVAAGQAAGAKNLLGAGLSLATLGMGGGTTLGGSLLSGAGSALNGLNLGQGLFGGGSPSGYGTG